MKFTFKKIVTVIILSLTMMPAMAQPNKTTNSEEDFNWDPIIDAIIQVESEGNAKAMSGIYCGAMQIAPILVEECNNILKSRGIKKRYSLSDRFSTKKSREMFKLYQSYHNPSNDVEKAIRSWNGGQRYSVRATNRYYRKVMAAMK